VPVWLEVVLAVVAWLVLALLLGLGLGAVIRRRNQQTERHERPAEEPDEPGSTN
jgi:uncharacterized protein YneF (UPF0154 family)